MICCWDGWIDKWKVTSLWKFVSSFCYYAMLPKMKLSLLLGYDTQLVKPKHMLKHVNPKHMLKHVNPTTWHNLSLMPILIKIRCLIMKILISPVPILIKIRCLVNKISISKECVKLFSKLAVGKGRGFIIKEVNLYCYIEWGMKYH